MFEPKMAQILVMLEIEPQLCVVMVFRKPCWYELLHSGMCFADKTISGHWIIAHSLSGNGDYVPKPTTVNEQKQQR